MLAVPQTDARPSAFAGRERLLIAGILGLALILRLWGLEHKSLDGGDEPFSLALAQRPLGEMFELFGFEANGSVYSILLWPLVRISEAEWMLRLPALVAGVLAVAAVWWAGRELVGPRAGLLAAGLMAVNPYAIYQSQYARPFSLVMLFSAVSFAALAVGLRDDRRRWWVLYVAATALAAYGNAVTAAILVPAHLVLVLVRRREALRTWLLSLLALGVALIPLGVAVAIARSRRDPLYWLESPGPKDVIIAGQDFASGLPASRPLFAVTALVLAVVVVAASRQDGRWMWPAPTPVIAWALVPMVVLVLASQVTPLFRSAYAIGAFPGLLLLAAACLDRLPRAVLGGALAALVGLALVGTTVQATSQHDETWRSATDWLKAEYRPGDRVLEDIPSINTVIGYYDQRFRAPNGELAVLEWQDNPFPRSVVPYDDPDGYAGPTGPPPRATIARLARGERRLFVFLAEYSEALQGDVPESAGLRWARRNCRVTEREETEITALLITGCP